MSRQPSWLHDVEGAWIEPFRRVISGIVHVLKIGARWRDCPAEYGPHTPFHPLEPAGDLVRDIRGTDGP